MTRTPLKLNASVLVLAAALSAAVVAGCSPPGANTTAQNTATAPALPLTTADVPPSAAAPLATALPAAAPARVVRLVNPAERYAYADRAYRYSQVLGDAPPDYTFDYDGVRPYVWNSDQETQLAEPTADGERYYYYDPGADQPFLIRDGGYAYGYDQGQLVVVYDSAGRTLDPSFVEQRADIAGRYLARARALYAASHQRQRQAVAARNWEVRRQQIDTDRSRWAAEQQATDWRDYHDAHDAQAQTYWQGEQARRAAEAAQYQQALGGAYDQGRADQRGRDHAVEGAGAVAALAAAAAVYNAGRHDHQGPPPVQAPVTIAPNHMPDRVAGGPTPVAPPLGGPSRDPRDQRRGDQAPGQPAQQQQPQQQQAEQQRQAAEAARRGQTAQQAGAAQQAQTQQAEAQRLKGQQDAGRQAALQARQQQAAEQQRQAQAQAAAAAAAGHAAQQQAQQQGRAQQDAARAQQQAQAAAAQQKAQADAAGRAQQQAQAAAQQQRAQADAAGKAQQQAAQQQRQAQAQAQAAAQAQARAQAAATAAAARQQQAAAAAAASQPQHTRDGAPRPTRQPPAADPKTAVQTPGDEHKKQPD